MVNINFKERNKELSNKLSILADFDIFQEDKELQDLVMYSNYETLYNKDYSIDEYDRFIEGINLFHTENERIVPLQELRWIAEIVNNLISSYDELVYNIYKDKKEELYKKMNAGTSSKDQETGFVVIEQSLEDSWTGSSYYFYAEPDLGNPHQARNNIIKAHPNAIEMAYCGENYKKVVDFLKKFYANKQNIKEDSYLENGYILLYEDLNMILDYLEQEEIRY